MTTRAQNVLQFIRNYHDRHGYAPTRREIGRGCKILSVSNVNGILFQLSREGKLEVTPRVQRGIRLVEETSAVDWVVLNQLAKQTEEKL